ncbi:hypothetical protein FisN_4Hh384 [Fistulifera solaris]|uniref:Uncharacterized protein n=1 Tax=Fistulifera solaris TaxID=1519565 RepID=A0A1Z5KQP0_FISSO|nr:hypothetical protein FisN_4Hh384 [Fistulifera solaris]|eukprot:GAX28425.1 hypothetical protein FisN_4Hh384 [Fistulifera solaris]
MLRRFLPSPRIATRRVRLLSTTASDRLVGYSPMAQGGPVNTNSTYIPTEKDVTTAGGVWAPTSAKRDALAEFKTAAAGKSLDEQATKEEKLDLYLVDGMILIGKCSDSSVLHLSEPADKMNAVETWWMKEKVTEDALLYQVQWKERLTDLSKKMDALLASMPADRCLRDIRDYMDAQDTLSDEEKKQGTPLAERAFPLMTVLEGEELTQQKVTEENLEQAISRFRLIIAQEAAKMLIERWDHLTTPSDHDVDRAAVQGIDLTKQDKVLSQLQMQSVLESFIQGDCASRVESLWALFDKEEDGLLDEDKMNMVCEMAIEPVGKALERLHDESLAASPARKPLEEFSAAPPSMGWRERRKDNCLKKNLKKMFRTTCKNHFRDEVEVNHRLRCIYAWANKKHQDNKIESVHVEEQGLAGRKRYVELKPKISLEEFREVQQIHFAHLDRVAQEFLKSYREDILIKQGKGRQRSEFYRESALFLTVVAIADFIITSL